jgi:hypothetical protein
MEKLLFGATRDDVSPHYGAFFVPIRRVTCSACPARYVIWGNDKAPDADKQDAVILLTQLVDRDHPAHRPVLCGAATLEELRKRAERRARAAGT